MKLELDGPDGTLSTVMRDAIARRIKTDIDKYCVDTYTDEHRSHLGASIIGHACMRNIWNAFRWIKREPFDARMLRLFNRGNLEEQRWIGWLRGAGFEVWEVDPNTQKQFRIWGAKLHYGGSSDAIARLPYPELLGMGCLLEFKTHNKDQFAKLVRESVMLSHPKHFSQMCAYGKEFGLRYGLYCASSKNDDDHHIEFLELDYSQADDMRKKAEDIIFATVPPPKISLQPTYYECKYCPFRGPCHMGELPDKSCRSCQYAFPVDNAEWYCSQYAQNIPKEFIPVGCERWVPVQQQ